MPLLTRTARTAHTPYAANQNFTRASAAFRLLTPMLLLMFRYIFDAAAQNPCHAVCLLFADVVFFFFFSLCSLVFFFFIYRLTLPPLFALRR